MEKITSHPGLQEEFLKCHYIGSLAIFRSQLLEFLTDQKSERGWRFHPLTEKYPKLNEKRPFKDVEAMDAVLDRLASISWNDKLLVEKSYYLLEELISYAKREGQKEIIEYIGATQEMLDEPEWEYMKMPWKIMTDTHLEHDLTLKDFKKSLKSTTEYCQLYRAECYKMAKKIKIDGMREWL
jgi:hypothetical protein